jgi:gluconate 2-dehydrogenase gamma chain
LKRDERVQRRRFLQVLGASSGAVLSAGACATTAGSHGLVPASPAAQARPDVASTPADALPEARAITSDAPEPRLTLNATEYAFVDAAVDSLIPADELTPSGSACGVSVFIDRQLAGAFGAGARMYRSGPFSPGKPEHGYQLPLTPRELFVSGIEAVNAWTQREHGAAFDALPEEARHTVLLKLERGETKLTVGQSFFELLLTLAMEGFFADPIYGGNRDMVAWKMVGYPGLPATYQNDITTYHGRRYERAPQSIRDFS